MNPDAVKQILERGGPVGSGWDHYATPLLGKLRSCGAADPSFLQENPKALPEGEITGLKRLKMRSWVDEGPKDQWTGVVARCDL